MPSSKRYADADIDVDDNDSVSGSSETINSSPAQTRKRRRVSDDSASTPGDHDSSERDNGSTPRSDYGDEVDEGEEEAATQAIREQKTREREKGGLAAECGILERVDLWDFMCHTEFTYKLGPHINFICGKNGSGKSAILTAIILCLGGKASATNRGQSLKKFIKEGRDQARIACTIKNQGDGAYLPEDYGDSIIVERHFSRSGTSGYKVKNERGRIISTKRAELENILDHFSLQIDNPLNVLSQDQARTFIQTSDPAVKYRFFIRGVQLEQLDQDYSLIEEQVDSIKTKLDKSKEDIDVLEEEVKKAKDKEDLAKQNDGLRSKHRELRRQYAWVQVKEQEDIRDTYTKEIEEMQEKIVQAETHVENLDEVYQISDRANEQAKTALDDAQAVRNQTEDDRREHQALYNEAKTAMSNAQSETRKLQASVKAHAESIKKIELEIEAEQRRLTELDGGGAAARLRELDDAKASAEQLKIAFEEHKTAKKDLELDKSNALTVMNERDEEQKLRKQDVDAQTARVDDLIKHKDQQDRAFKPNTDKLLREIDKEKRWTQKPIGPLGKHVRLTRPEWSSIIERTFGNTLSGFYVVSKQDADLLGQLKRRVNCDADVFIGNRHLITPNEPDERFDTILRVLEIDNEYVKKQLIINHTVEQTLLIPDIEQANREMYDSGRLRNVKASFSFHPRDRRRGIMLKYTPSGHASQDPIPEWRGQARMRTNTEATVALARQSLLEAKDRLHTAETAFRTARESHKKAGQALERHKRRENELLLESRAAEDKVSAIEDAINEDSVESGKLEALKEGLSEQQGNKSLQDELYQDAVVAQDRKKEALHRSRRAFEEISANTEELQKEVEIKKAEAAKADKKRSHDLHAKNEAVSLVEEANRDRQTIETKKAELEQKIAEFIEEARQISERINLPDNATQASIEAKMKRLKRDIERFQQQQLGMSVQQAAEAYAKASAAYKQAVRDNRSLQAVNEQLKESLIERRARWDMFRRLISTRAKAMFIYLLAERSFRGKILTDHRRKLLDIAIEPDITTKSGSGRNAKTLSGGEKSFSQICLLLSIWEAMGSPIRCLDEFDVYMDAVNRNMSVRMIIEAARGSPGRQYILISPGSKVDIPRAPDVNVVELDKPERGQQTLRR